jgi:hypothetical protein
MLSRYDIVLIAFPFTDGPAAKAERSPVGRFVTPRQ